MGAKDCTKPALGSLFTESRGKGAFSEVRIAKERPRRIRYFCLAHALVLRFSDRLTDEEVPQVEAGLGQAVPRQFSVLAPPTSAEYARSS